MDEFEGEILFLADRSGSMDGPKIDELKDALLVFLKSLPTKCKFNIYSFGDHVSSLWSHSSAFWGTQVLEALRKAVGDRQSTAVSSTQVVLLTDGEIWQPEQVIDFVRMTTSDSDSQVRFFSLGIGNQVNHQLIKGIGLFGGGFGEAVDVDAHGKWAEALIRMLKGAMMPTSWSYSIKFDKQWKEKRLDIDELFSEGSRGKLCNDLKMIAGTITPSFVQAPRTIPWLHHFSQQSVYFLLDTTSDNIPDHVLITACSRHGVTKTATLAVTKSASNNNAIQHLAAKAVMRDLEIQDTSGARRSSQILMNAERLCQMYSVSSKWASFVAVSHLQQSASYDEVEVNLYKAPLAELDLLTLPSVSQAGANLGILPGLPTGESATALSQCCLLAGQLTRTSIDFLQPSIGSVQKKHMGPEVQMEHLDGPVVAPESQKRIESVLRSKQSPSIDVQNKDQYAINWQEIVRGQRADGLFHLEKRLSHCMVQHFCHGTRQLLERWLMERVKRPLTDVGEESEAMRLLVETVMALAYIRTHFYSQRALWDLLVQKAEGRLASFLNPGEWTRSDGLSATAESAVAHANYGRSSQGGDEGPGRKFSPGSGLCDVCDSQGEQRMSSAKPNDGLDKCSVSGCDVNMD